MKTKTRIAVPTRRAGIKSRLPLRAPVSPELPKPERATLRVLLHPTKCEVFNEGENEPHFRIANGGPGSDAAAKVDEALKKLGATATLDIRYLDGSGREIGSTKPAKEIVL